MDKKIELRLTLLTTACFLATAGSLSAQAGLTETLGGIAEQAGVSEAVGAVSGATGLSNSSTNLGGASHDGAAKTTYVDVVTSLRTAGYEILKVQGTFLGRKKILARNELHLREVIVSRNTGEILRDVILKRYSVAKRSSAGGG